MDRKILGVLVISLIIAGSGGAFLWGIEQRDTGEENPTPSSENVEISTPYPYTIVDTGQTKCYNNTSEIPCPEPGDPFYGQDAQYQGYQPKYRDNGDGTVTDLNTGLMWTKSPDWNGDGVINYDDKMSYEEAIRFVNKLNEEKYLGYDDWRLPSIKELYSLIEFSGTDPDPNTPADELIPFIDTEYFDFAYGDISAGERIIDAQFLSSTKYVSTTMNGDETVFGVNFADGRIKGYGLQLFGKDKKFYVLFVRGNPNYGKNDFTDNGDGTITDKATGLMWTKYDSGYGMTWEEALEWVQQKNKENYLGYNDWRLPNAKELQSIVDYTRSPDTTNSPAIDPIFECTQITNEAGEPDYPYYWTSTTHASLHSGETAVYIAFGRALGWMQSPNGSYILMDVHGAGAQRCEPKSGDPSDYPHGHGPQGDVVRIYNFVRLVRGGLPDNQTTEKLSTPRGPTSGNAGSNSGWLGSYDSGEEVSAASMPKDKMGNIILPSIMLFIMWKWYAWDHTDTGLRHNENQITAMWRSIQKG